MNNLPSRQRITNAEEVVGKLNETAVRLGIFENLCSDLDTAIIPADEMCKMFVQQSLSVNNEMCKDIEKNTRKQNECQECMVLTKKVPVNCIIFSCVMKRRKNIYPKSIVEKIQKPNKICSASCRWGIDNEQKALDRYHNLKEEINQHVDLCAACGLVVNPKWPWLGASPDVLTCDNAEVSLYGAVEVAKVSSI